MKDEEEIDAVAIYIGAMVMRRFELALREDGATDEAAISHLAVLAGAVTIPLMRTFLSEDDPATAIGEIDDLERLLTE
jgi:hypothetical protein